MPPPDNATPHKSSSYDFDVRQTIPFYETMQHQALDLVHSMRPDVRVWLDTGCGTGYLVEQALALFPLAHFTLADPAPAMMERSAERLGGFSGNRVRLLAPKPTEQLTTADVGASPQVITAMMCHHYMPATGRGKATQRCYELLEPGGLYITFENIALRSARGVQWGLERWARFQRHQGRSAQTVESHVQRYNTAYFPITVDQHLDLLARVGFRVAELCWLSHMQAGLYAIK
jgi:tRNA (cmo5U34)-methyltransferase